jgi:hypothetical protein
MHLKGSCHCGRVHFELDSAEPWPYQRCHCSICRKTAGGGGYCINLGGDARSFRVKGAEYVSVYRALIDREGRRVRSEHERHFCQYCGSHLWAFNPRWPDLIHPVASAIDTPLPTPPEIVNILVDSRAPWVERRQGETEHRGYPSESLAAFHQRHGYRDPE